MKEPKRPNARHRLPTDQEIELWSIVTADVKPFRERPVRPKPEPAHIALEPRALAQHVQHVEKHVHPRAVPPLSDIDHRTRTKIRRGKLEVDAKLDLHGMRQAEAQHALFAFLRRVQAEGGKVAIVVTGKGSTGEEGGVLRRMAPMWLQAPNMRDVVVGYGEAARNHGGEGALYVRIRRLARRN